VGIEQRRNTADGMPQGKCVSQNPPAACPSRSAAVVGFHAWTSAWSVTTPHAIADEEEANPCQARLSKIAEGPAGANPSTARQVEEATGASELWLTKPMKRNEDIFRLYLLLSHLSVEVPLMENKNRMRRASSATCFEVFSRSMVFPNRKRKYDYCLSRFSLEIS
jgi:hypothetical protein